MMNQIQKREANVPAAQGTVNVLGHATKEDFNPPEFRLVSPVSEVAQNSVAKAGNWYSEQLSTERATIRAALLAFQPGRILWNTEEMGKPRCSSDDGIMPRPGGEFEAMLEQGGCAVCPQNFQGRGACSVSYSMLFYDLDEEFEFLLRISSWSGVTAVRTMNTALRVATRGLGDAYRFPVLFQSVRKTNAKGTPYFAPQFLVQGKEPLDGEQLEQMKFLAAQYAGIDFGTLVADEKKEEAAEKPKRQRRAQAAVPEPEVTPDEADESGDDDLY